MIEIERDEFVVEKQIVVDREVPYEIVKEKIVEVETKCPEPVPEKIQYAKVIEVPTNIPVFVEKPVYEVIEKRVPYVVKR